jgi:signal transduction histidine kinase
MTDEELASAVETAYQRGWDRREMAALEELERLDALARQADRPELQAKTALALARLYRIRGDSAAAATLLDRALAMDKRVSTQMRILLSNYMGVCLIDGGELASALAPVMHAYTLAREVNPSSAGIAATNLGLCLLDLGDFEGAGTWLARARWEGQTEFSLAHVVFAKAMLAWRASDGAGLQRALVEFGALIDDNALDGAERDRVYALWSLARAWAALASGDDDACESAVAHAEEGFGGDGNTSEFAEVCLVQATLAQRQGRLAAASEAVERGLAVQPDPSLAYMLRLLAGEVELARGEPTRAAEHYRAAAQAHEAPRAALGRTLRRTLERLEQHDEDAAAALEVSNQALRRANRSLDEARRSLEERVAERTEELRAEVAEREAAERRALASDEAKTRFLASMSHELRTPLNAILGYAALLLEDGEDDGAPSEWLEDLGRIQEAGARLLALIDHLLVLARLDAGADDGDTQEHDLEVLLEGAGALAGVPTKVRLDKPLRTQRAEVPQLVTQLLRTATDRGGAVRLEADEREGRVRVRVIDAGPRLTDESLAQLHDPFARVDPRKADGGLGQTLGLAVSRALCESLRGSFRVDCSGSTTAVSATFVRDGLEA